MLCTGRILAASNFLPHTSPFNRSGRYTQGILKSNLKWRCTASTSASASDSDGSSFAPSIDSQSSSDRNAAGFCIIEGPETVQDFAKMELQEIHDNIRSRRNKIFLQMEEVRRLRIQQRIKSAELGIVKDEQKTELPSFPSFIPFLPPLKSSNLRLYYASCFSLIAGIMTFGGFLAPTLELKLGLGGTSYADFIRSMHLPMQLRNSCGGGMSSYLLDRPYTLAGSVDPSDNWENREYPVDPIVASFSGGAVGVISALMVVEINNVKQQEHKRCKYCLGTGYLACARCSSTGALVLSEPLSTLNGEDQPLSLPKTARCPNCSGSGKVMCPTCLCTGMAMASEHDPRIDPFD